MQSPMSQNCNQKNHPNPKSNSHDKTTGDAATRLNELLSDFPLKVNQPNVKMEKFQIKSDQVGCLMGKNSAGMKKITETSGARVNVLVGKRGATHRVVEVTGTKQAICKARELIGERLGLDVPV